MDHNDDIIFSDDDNFELNSEDIEMIRNMVSRQLNDIRHSREDCDSFVLNYPVIAKINELRLWLFRDYEIESEIKFDFDFGIANLIFLTDMWGTEGIDSKREFEYHLHNADAFQITHRIDGLTEIEFQYENPFLFFNSK